MVGKMRCNMCAPGSEGRPYDLFSLGADGQQGGEGQDADLYAQL